MKILFESLNFINHLNNNNMKKIWIFLFILLSESSSAQITLDHEVDSLFLTSQFKTVQISPAETKYFVADTLTNTFSLLNLDFTPFLSNIVVPEPFAIATVNMQALYITRTLFDCDSSNIEYAYTSPSDINKPFRILRTDGTLLFQLDSANGPYCYGNCLGGTDLLRPIINTSNGAKLFLQKYNAGYEQIFIYSLCGNLPSDVFDTNLLNQIYVTVYPNPSSSSVTFNIDPPDNISEFELAIIDSNAHQVKCEKINSNFRNYMLNTSNMSSGTYFYSLCTKYKSYQTGKFIITK